MEDYYELDQFDEISYSQESTPSSQDSLEDGSVSDDDGRDQDMEVDEIGAALGLEIGAYHTEPHPGMEIGVDFAEATFSLVETNEDASSARQMEDLLAIILGVDDSPEAHVKFLHHTLYNLTRNNTGKRDWASVTGTLFWRALDGESFPKGSKNVKSKTTSLLEERPKTTNKNAFARMCRSARYCWEQQDEASFKQVIANYYPACAELLGDYLVARFVQNESGSLPEAALETIEEPFRSRFVKCILEAYAYSHEGGLPSFTEEWRPIFRKQTTELILLGYNADLRNKWGIASSFSGLDGLEGEEFRRGVEYLKFLWTRAKCEQGIRLLRAHVSGLELDLRRPGTPFANWLERDFKLALKHLHQKKVCPKCTRKGRSRSDKHDDSDSDSDSDASLDAGTMPVSVLKDVVRACRKSRPAQCK